MLTKAMLGLWEVEHRETVKENRVRTAYMLGDLEDTTRRRGIWRGWGCEVGRPMCYRVSVGLAAMFQYISFRFEETGFIRKGKQDIVGENFGPYAQVRSSRSWRLERARGQHLILMVQKHCEAAGGSVSFQLGPSVYSYRLSSLSILLSESINFRLYFPFIRSRNHIPSLGRIPASLRPPVYILEYGGLYRRARTCER